MYINSLGRPWRTYFDFQCKRRPSITWLRCFWDSRIWRRDLKNEYFTLFLVSYSLVTWNYSWLWLWLPLPSSSIIFVILAYSRKWYWIKTTSPALNTIPILWISHTSMEICLSLNQMEFTLYQINRLFKYWILFVSQAIIVISILLKHLRYLFILKNGYK